MGRKTHGTDGTAAAAPPRCSPPTAALRVTEPLAYRQVGVVAVPVVHGSDHPGPPRPPADVADFGRFVPADAEEPLPDQLRPSLDCHGPSLVNPPSKKLPDNDALQPRYQRHGPSWGESAGERKRTGTEFGEEAGTEPRFKRYRLHPRERRSLFCWNTEPHHRRHPYSCLSAGSQGIHRPHHGRVPPPASSTTFTRLLLQAVSAGGVARSARFKPCFLVLVVTVCGF